MIHCLALIVREERVPALFMVVTLHLYCMAPASIPKGKLHQNLKKGGKKTRAELQQLLILCPAGTVHVRYNAEFMSENGTFVGWILFQAV